MDFKNKTLLMLMMLGATSSCAFAPWENKTVLDKDYKSQIEKVKEEAKTYPEQTVKRKNLLVTHELVATKLIKEAEEARLKGNYSEASNLYDQVLAFLPDDLSALNGKSVIDREVSQKKKIESVESLIESNQLPQAKELLRDLTLESPHNAKVINLQKLIHEKEIPKRPKPPEIKSQIAKPVSLELRDVNIKVVFEALSRATGINFILDKDIKPDTKATIFVKRARMEDALEMVLSSNGLQKKVLSDNTVLVYPSTQIKLKDYQDLVIRSFYLTNTSAKQVSTLLKTMLKTKDIFVDERLNMLVMRDTPEVIRIAEKLVAANDLEEPEVMLEIEVLEVSRSRLQQLGVEFPNRVSVNSLIPITTVTSATGVLATSTVNSASQLTLEGLLNINKGRLDVSPNPAVNFRKITGDVNLLSNPRIRVKNNEKAKVLVGDKVPIITTTSTANVGISESVQYVDVGLKLDVEPRITLNNYVNIKIGLEVSSLGERTITQNGATVYTIGTRNANTVLRLKDGETQILAGLILDDERKSASKLPGLGDVPLIGRLFSNQEDRKNKTEIVLAITPRVIGNINLPQAEISEYWSGTESVITDKPQTGFTPGAAPLTPREQYQERIRQQQNASTPAAIEESPVSDTQNIPATESQPPSVGVEKSETNSSQPASAISTP